MKEYLPIPFPRGVDVSKDSNPAIRLFGKRFIVDQPIPELLVEFLLVVYSEKKIGEAHNGIAGPLPALEQIKEWPDGRQLSYRPILKMNLKLFAFLSSSRLDTRHEVHIDHFQRLWHMLQKEIYSVNYDGEQVVEWLEDLLRGFKGAGLTRTWCAQSFFPIATSLLTPETIWNETKAKNDPVSSWHDSLRDFNKYYSTSRRNFLAHGGEVLYLQLCNAFSRDQTEVEAFSRSFRVSQRERCLRALHEDLRSGLELLYGRHDGILNSLVKHIESLDPETAKMASQNSRWLDCEWCPEESWQEGYLFALELKRLLLTALDPVEKLELMMTGCALQVLRSLCAQSARTARESTRLGGGFGYSWIYTPAFNPSRSLMLTSQRNLQVILGLLQKAIRSDALLRNAKEIEEPSGRRTIDQILKEADDKYGYKLFRLLGKRLGMIVPYKGPGARFVMTDSLLRYFVLTLLEPRESCSYDDFLDRLYRNHGIAVEGENLRDSILWSNLPPNLSTQYEDSSWLREMLRAGGFLTELSDGYSVVTNTFDMVQAKEEVRDEISS